MASEARHVYGPRSIGVLIPPLTRPAFRRRGPQAAQVMADWAAIVGPGLARQASPRRLRAGTLTLACTGTVAIELQHQADELIARINGHLGVAVVRSLRLVQDQVPASLANWQPGVLAALPAASGPPAPSHEARQAADRAVQSVPAGPLRDALAALGRAILTHSTKRPHRP